MTEVGEGDVADTSLVSKAQYTACQHGTYLLYLSGCVRHCCCVNDSGWTSLGVLSKDVARLHNHCRFIATPSAVSEQAHVDLVGFDPKIQLAKFDTSTPSMRNEVCSWQPTHPRAIQSAGKYVNWTFQ